MKGALRWNGNRGTRERFEVYVPVLIVPAVDSECVRSTVKCNLWFANAYFGLVEDMASRFRLLIDYLLTHITQQLL